VRHFLSVKDLSPGEVEGLFRAAEELKHRAARGVREDDLAGRTVGLFFEKQSLRTRLSFEVAIGRLGGSAVFVGPEAGKIGERESAADFARVAGRYLDALVLRVHRHEILEEAAAAADVPVINALSERFHPCQALSDLFTIREKLGRTAGVKVAFIGDGNNVARSLAHACGRCGATLTIASPGKYELTDEFAGTVAPPEALRRVRDPREAVAGADVVYTDVFVSMGEEGGRERKRAAFAGYQVNKELLAAAPKGALVMHCLPARRGEEISAAVLDGPRSAAIDQAENRLHVQEALLRLIMTSRPAAPTAPAAGAAGE